MSELAGVLAFLALMGAIGWLLERIDAAKNRRAQRAQNAELSTAPDSELKMRSTLSLSEYK